MKLNIHRRAQWDLWQPAHRGGDSEREDVKPWIACHVKRGNVTKRIFVLWRNGFRGFGADVRWCCYGRIPKAKGPF